MTSAPAVQLFLDRARDAGAEIREDGQPAVAELCRRLDGIPLALEIAAARARTMSVAEIAARVGEDVGVLHRPRYRGAGPAASSRRSAGRTTSSTMAKPGVLDRLGVFAGRFPVEVAGEIVAFDDAERACFDDRFDALLHASLVAADTSTTATRYRLLDTVRRLALDRLRERGELDTTYDRFADHVVQWSVSILSCSTASWRPELVTELLAAYDNIADGRIEAAVDSPATSARSCSTRRSRRVRRSPPPTAR